MWIYLLIAFVVLPMFVPFAVVAVEPTALRRRRMAPFVALGAGVTIVLFAAMLRAPVDVVELAAVSAAAIALHMRLGKPHPAARYLLA